MRVLGVLLLVAAIGLVAYVGCGPRGQVAMDEITKRLDKALGELNVKRKSIENKQNELQGKLNLLKEQRYKAEARLDLLKSKKANHEGAVKEMTEKVTQIAALVKEANESSEKKITRNGKEYSAEELQKAANEVATKFKAEKASLEAQNLGYKTLESSVNFLKGQETEAGKLMDQLKSKIADIDAKKIAVDAVRQNTGVVGDNKSISAGLEGLQKEIEDLGVEVEAALKMEADKMSELTSSSSVADELLTAPVEDLGATQKMLDDLLK